MSAIASETQWDLLAYPRLCGLAAKRPTKLSQAMHNAGFQALGLPFVYVGFDVDDCFDVIMLLRKLGARGFSLTVPHKEAAMPYVDSLDNHAEKIGAINTIINDGCSLHGVNTDWIGVRKALQEANISLAGKKALVLGAGGAAKAAIYALQQEKADTIFVANRTPARAVETANKFGVQTLAIEEIAKREDLSLIVNATPAGSHLGSGPGRSPIEDFFEKSVKPAYFEMVTVPTAASQSAAKAGLPVIEGSRMLFYQALEQFRLFTEHEPPHRRMEDALTDALKSA